MLQIGSHDVALDSMLNCDPGDMTCSHIQFCIKVEFKQKNKMTWASGFTWPKIRTRLKYPGEVKAVSLMLTTTSEWES